MPFYKAFMLTMMLLKFCTSFQWFMTQMLLDLFVSLLKILRQMVIHQLGRIFRTSWSRPVCKYFCGSRSNWSLPIFTACEIRLFRVSHCSSDFNLQSNLYDLLVLFIRTFIRPLRFAIDIMCQLVIRHASSKFRPPLSFRWN